MAQRECYSKEPPATKMPLPVRPVCRALDAPPSCLPLGAELPRCLLHPDSRRRGGPAALRSAGCAGGADGARGAGQGGVVGVVDVGVGASG